MNSEKICLASKTIDIAEHDLYLELTNCHGYYDDKNLNNVMLPYKGCEEAAKAMAATLVNMPVQAKYKKIKGNDDLGSHELSINEDGEVIWGTETVGVNVEAWISEPEEVITVSGENKKLPCLYSKARIWKRNPRMISAIKRLYESENGLNSSWEISTTSYEFTKGIKKLTDYVFMGFALLGSTTTAAYNGTSRAINLSALSEQELLVAEALSQDIIENGAFDINKNQESEEDSLKDDKNLDLSSEEIKEGEVENADTENTPANDEASENTVEETPTTSEKDDEDKEENDDDVKDDNDNDDVEDEEDNDDDKKKETDTSKCGGDSDKKKKKETSEVSDTEVSQLTVHDLRRKIEKACRKKIDSYCYIQMMFPEEKEVWVYSYEECESELDCLKFTYSVENDEVTVSDAEKVKLIVTPREINSTVSELNEQISSKDEIILKSSQTITELNAQITELSTYKEKFEKSEQEKIEAELAEKKEQLISSVVKSGQITREEIEASEELKGFVENLDSKSLMAIVGERVLASITKESKTVETSEVKESIHVSTNLNSADDEVISQKDKVSALRRYLNK